MAGCPLSVAKKLTVMRLLTRQKWESGKLAWNDALAKYREHHENICQKVPSTLQEFERLQQQYDFHDEPLIRFHRLARDHVTLEMGRYWVEIYDVEECRYDTLEIERNIIWLYHEIDYVSPQRFRLMVLFEAAELDVVAGTIHVYSRHEHKLLVPAAHSPVSGTVAKKKRR